MNEQATFDRLRRGPIELVYNSLGEFMTDVMRRRQLSCIDTSHPDVIRFIEVRGYTRQEILDYHKIAGAQYD